MEECNNFQEMRSLLFGNWVYFILRYWKENSGLIGFIHSIRKLPTNVQFFSNSVSDSSGQVIANNANLIERERKRKKWSMR